MAFLFGALKRAGYVKTRQPLGILTRASLQWPQNFHTCRQYFFASKEDEKPALEDSSPTKSVEDAQKIENRSRRWSAFDEALLDQMRRDERSKSEMSEALGRSIPAIRYKLSSLYSFSPSDDDQILKAQQEGLTWQQLGERLPMHSMRQIRLRWGVTKGCKGKLAGSKGLRRFSVEEDVQLKQLRDQGLPWAEIAKAFGGRRDRSSLATRYDILVPASERVKVRPQRFWSEDDVKRLLAMENVSDKKAASVLGKSVWAVRGKRQRLRRPGAACYNSRSWTKREDQLCLELVANGQNSREIAKVVKRSLEAIECRLRFLKRLDSMVGEDDPRRKNG